MGVWPLTPVLRCLFGLLTNLFFLQQARIAEMIQNSGDNSAQLAALNEKVREKEKQIEELQLAVGQLQHELGESREQCEALRKSGQELAASLKSTESQMQQRVQSLVNDSSPPLDFR